MSKDQFKAKAKRLVSLLSAHEGPVLFQDALEVLAQLEGHRNWQTLSALLDQDLVGSPTGRAGASARNPQDIPFSTPEGAAIRNAFAGEFNVLGTRTGRLSCATSALSGGPSEARTEYHVPNETPYRQEAVPGVGYLFSVPISVDTSMTARVLVRARNRQDAVEEARRLVSEGKAPMELDEGNYRGPGDYYCSDCSENGVYCPAEPAEPTVIELDEGGQVGPYLVEVFKDFDDPTQVWADLVVFDAGEEGPIDEGGDPLSVLTVLNPDAALSEHIAFCLRTAHALSAHFPDASKVDRKAIEHMFRQLAQAV